METGKVASMKFYFCEKCGKRVTENDIEGGTARDKKLRGVYCRACAVGVMTMESLPMSDAQARQVLSKSESNPDRTNSSARNLKPARNRKASGSIARSQKHFSTQPRSTRHSSSSPDQGFSLKTTALLAGGAGLIGLIVLLYMPGSKSESKTFPESKFVSKRGAKPAPAPRDIKRSHRSAGLPSHPLKKASISDATPVVDPKREEVRVSKSSLGDEQLSVQWNAVRAKAAASLEAGEWKGAWLTIEDFRRTHAGTRQAVEASKELDAAREQIEKRLRSELAKERNLIEKGAPEAAWTFLNNLKARLPTVLENLAPLVEAYATLGVRDPSVNLKQGLLGYWKFNEEKMGDPVKDASGGGVQGTHGKSLTAPFGPSTDVPPVPFENPRSVAFNGKGDCISFGNAGFLDGLTALSVAFWFKKIKPTWHGAAVSKDDAVEFFLSRGKKNAYGISVNNQKMEFDAPVPLGVWTHVVFTWEGGTRDTRKVYENGILKGTLQGSARRVSQSSSNLLVGARKKYPFNGKVDELRIYNRALTQQEIAFLARRKTVQAPSR